jgi:hypothetical protein
MKSAKMYMALTMLILLVGCSAAYQGSYENRDSGRYMPSYGDNGPAFSSPPVRMAPNGDRVSQYPPYFHPDH